MATKKTSPEHQELIKFYKPYLSDEDEISDTESDSSGSESSGSESSSMSDSASEQSAAELRQNIFASNAFPVGKMSGDKQQSATTNFPVALNQTTTKFASAKNSTTIMLNSTDRDTNIYPQPTFFSIRLPRIYRNVVGISVIQIKLLSSFYYFSAAKNNTSIRVLEYGRQITNSAGKLVDNAIDVYLKDGTYDTNSLVTQLQNQLNRSPLYNNISLTTFIGKFISTGDYGLLFNDPGDTTYNPLTGVFDALQFKTQIINRYFNTVVSTGIAYYSTSECIVAYYYPMLRDMTINNVPVVTPVPINPYAQTCSQFIINGAKTYDALDYYNSDAVAISYLAGTSSYDRIVYGFQGLSDPYINLLISDPANQVILQKYKDDNTWSGFLLNNYTCSYDGTSGRLSIYSSHLNTSLVTTLNNQYQTILLQQYINGNIDPNNVPSIQTNSENLNGVVIDMYNYIQTAFTNNFAVNFGTYKPTFFTDLSNAVFVSEAAGRYGWNLIYTGAQQISTSVVKYPDASGSWPSLVFNPAKMNMLGNDLFYTGPDGNVIQYTYTQDGLQSDASGNIILNGSNEETLGYQDISFNIIPTTYVRVPFKSRCRQTLYIETIPPFSAEVPTDGKLAEQYFMDKVNTPLLYQDISGVINLLDPTYSDFFMYDISQNMLDGPDFMRQNTSYGQLYQSFLRQQKPVSNPDIIPPPGSLSMYPFRPHVFIEIHHSLYPGLKTDTMFSSDIYIEREDNLPIGVNINAYWYRDRAAFMADVSGALVNVFWNNPKHYFNMSSISGTSKGGIINANFISNQTSYLMVTTTAINFDKIPLRIFTVLHNSYGVYTIPGVADYRRLPVNATYLSTKTTPETNVPPNLPTLFNSSSFRNCYDLSGISNNLLDFFILTTDFAHYDPYNLVNNTTLNQNPLRYVFQFKTPSVTPGIAVSDYSQFFPAGSSNLIINNLDNSIYYNPAKAAAEIANKTTAGIANEYVFVNWFRAGVLTNLYNGGITSPLLVPEETIVPFVSLDVNGVDNPFSLVDSISYSSMASNPNYMYYKFTPFALCKNKTDIITDISFNDLSSLFRLAPGQIYLGPDRTTGLNNYKGIMGIPFIPPLGRYVVPKQIVIKFSYVQPTYDVLTNQLGRSNKLGLTTSQEYRYVTKANNTTFTNPITDMGQFDDQYYLNRRNVVLGVFFSSAIKGTNVANLQLENALCTLTLKKVTQIAEYSSSTDPNAFFSRTRSPEWGTYYVYETSAANNLWVPVTQTFNSGSNNVTTKWAAINKQADFVQSIFTTAQAADDNTKAYYTDISNNSLCFVPFYPILTPDQLANSQDAHPNVAPFVFDYSTPNWRVGSFNALTYTTRPYLPIIQAASLTENPYIFYRSGLNSVCPEIVGSGGISLGDTSTYLGAAGPLCWAYDISGNIGSPNYRRTTGFSPTFFNCRINLTISDAFYNPVTDLTAFGGLEQVNQCYTDTQMYLYDLVERPGSDYADIIGAWGAEKSSRFEKFDDDSGYNYLSYIPKVKIDKGGIYTIQIRGYVPTVKFLSGIRIAGKNWTDFGEVTLKNLCDEIADLQAGGVSVAPDGSLINDPYRISHHYSSDYVRSLLEFNAFFIGTNVFGRGFANASYGGKSITSTGFADFLDQYAVLVNEVSTMSSGITVAQANANALMKSYISTTYAGILPPLVLTRNNFTDPLTFSIKFQSALIPPYSKAYDQWGLGWNLGFAKIDTPFTTRHVANSFIKIVDDFIYIMLDEALNLNGVDISNKEDLSVSRDTFGEKQKYYGKLLLNSFGSFSQTLVQSAKAFTNPVGKLEKLTFSLHDANNQPIKNNDCEYNIVLEISEMVDSASVEVAKA